MLTSHFNPRAVTHRSHWPCFLIFILIVTLYGISAADTKRAVANSPNGASHVNFFRSTLRGRQRTLTCDKDPKACLDRDKNPWGGTTCCFQRFCKDTANDINHCGECGKKCEFGMVCCDGKCVDIQRDSQHCGACFEVCPRANSCSYAMCDYGE